MYYSDNSQNNNEKVLKAVEKALDAVKNIKTFEFRTKLINEAIKSNNHQFMVQIINKKWNEYKSFANSLSSITNYYVRVVDDNFYDDKSIEFLVNQLKDIKIFVSLKILIDKANKDLFVKVMKEFGVLTDEQLKNIFRSNKNGIFNSQRNC